MFTLGRPLAGLGQNHVNDLDNTTAAAWGRSRENAQARLFLGDAYIAAGFVPASELVSASVFLLVTGLLNSTQWYPWDFSFRRSHYALAWVATGALVLHLAVKLPTIREALGRDVDDTGLDRPEAVVRGGLSRRGLLRSTWAAAGLAVLATAGSTVPWLRRVSVLGVRSGDGPGGVPINRTAAAAGVSCPTSILNSWVKAPSAQ